MVCIYCGHDTRVINSRHQKRENHVWRRRQCVACHTIFTSEEAIELTGTIRVATPNSKTLRPFSRDTLFLSIHRSLGHRQDATEAAGALCATIIGKLTQKNTGALLEAPTIAQITHVTLQHFDAAAAVSYAAYHRLQLR